MFEDIRRENYGKALIKMVVFFIWTLICIYGSYNNTVRLMEIHTVGNGYEVIFHNTDEVHYYESGM